MRVLRLGVGEGPPGGAAFLLALEGEVLEGVRLNDDADLLMPGNKRVVFIG